jgi:UDP-3-O-[3-hydroxymyristoyl] glucosamine N-acyltransferase
MRLDEIAALVGGRLDGPPDVEITGVAALEAALPGTITFVADQARASELAATQAAAAIVGEDVSAAGLPVVRAAQPYAAFVRVVEVLHPRARPAAGRHPSAVVAPTAEVPADAHVGPHVVVGEGVRLGARAVLHAGACLYDDVGAGGDFTMHAGAVVREGTRIGHRVVVHAGAVVGSDGFGYLPTGDLPRPIPQIGIVRLEDDVEIGANAAVDRAALGVTVIGRGTKIDDLVMVAHGCAVGEACLLAGQVGLAGGTRLGRGVMLGGQVGSAGHLAIGDGAMVAAKSGISGDLAAGGVYGGIPAQPIQRWRRAVSAAGRVSSLLRRVRRLERALGAAADDDES